MQIVAETDDYIHAEATSRIFRFVDDVEFFVDRGAKVIHFRSASRVGRSDMGVNLMRLGLEDEARKQLEQTYNAGYQNPETVNSLRLLDSYKNYDTFRTPTTILRLHRKESALLRPYFQAEFDRALATYEKKYKMKLNGPVQVEVYPDHEDFAVRTMGMPGLGALGVTFGAVVAMDSPSGRQEDHPQGERLTAPDLSHGLPSWPGCAGTGRPPTATAHPSHPETTSPPA